MARYDEVMDINARSQRAKMPGKTKPPLDHIRISEAENGGHIVEHHFEASSIHPYREPMKHAFAAVEGGDKGKVKLHNGSLLHHVAQTMHIPHEVISLGQEKDEHEPKESPHEKETAGHEDGEGAEPAYE